VQPVALKEEQEEVESSDEELEDAQYEQLEFII